MRIGRIRGLGLPLLAPYMQPSAFNLAPAPAPTVSTSTAPAPQSTSIVSTTSVPQVTAPVPQMLSIPQPSPQYSGQAIAPASGTSAGIADNSSTAVLPGPTSGADTYQGIDLTSPVDTSETEAVLAAAQPVAIVAPSINPLWLLAGGLALLALL